jgi:glycosyltransferase involved in cell wall biosynthesis
MDQQNRNLTLSIVIPVYSGERFLARLISSISDLRKSWANSGVAVFISEAIFVLDDPVDDSAMLLRRLAKNHAWVRVIELTRNYGQHSATIAGILYSSGDWVVTMDEDLQHRPEQIGDLFRAITSNQADIAYASPTESTHGGGYRDKLSRTTKSVIAKLSGNRFVRSFNSFRLMRGDIARAAASIGAQYTYFDVTLTWFTERIVSVELDMSDDRYKEQKRSGYRFGTLARHATKMILTSNFQVLRLTTALSALSFATSIIVGAWVIYSKFFAAVPVEVPGWASLMIIVLAFGSVSVFMLGLIVEFLHSSMLQLQGKPTYFVVDRSSDQELAREVSKLPNP